MNKITLSLSLQQPWAFALRRSRRCALKEHLLALLEDLGKAISLKILVHGELGFNVVPDPLWPVEERLSGLFASLEQPLCFSLHLNQLRLLLVSHDLRK